MPLVYSKLFFTMIFWGGTFVAGRILVSETGPFLAALMRFSIASVLLLLLSKSSSRRLPRLTGRQFFGVVLLGVSGVFAYNTCFFAGLESVDAGRASLVIAANPVMIAIFSSLFMGERQNWLGASSVMISLLGVVIVISDGDLYRLFHGNVGIGEIYLLGSVLSWVSYTLIGKKMLQGLSAFAAVTYSVLVGTVLLTIPVIGDSFKPVLTLSLQAWFSLFVLSALGTVLGFVWYYQAIQKIGAIRAGQFINFVPVCAVTLGVLILDESPTGSLILGGSLVLIGVYLNNSSKSLVN